MNLPVDVSIIVCTYNRAARLKEVVEMLASLAPAPGSTHEFLIVDNNSSDGTHEVVKEAILRHGETFRYIFETRQGLSWARNTGIASARGRLIAFTDDDVRIDRNWLAVLCRTAKNDPQAAFGGRILPLWEISPPSWFIGTGPFKMLKGGVIVGHDLGEERREYTLEMQTPVGANMAFRREVFERHGLFRTDLGKTGKKVFFGEDADIFTRLLRAGEKVLYVPDALIYHPVDQERMTKRNFLVSYFNIGRTLARTDSFPQDAVRYWGVPRYLFRMLMGEVWKRTAALASARYKEALFHKFEIHFLLGQIVESVRWPASRPKPPAGFEISRTVRPSDLKERSGAEKPNKDSHEFTET